MSDEWACQKPEVRVAGFKRESVVDGPGLCAVLFVQGCLRDCPGCHNPQNQPLHGGKKMGIDSIMEELCASPGIEAVALSGGEPFLQAAALVELCRKLQDKNLKIIIYTGYTFAEVMREDDCSFMALLENADILIDGPFIQEEYDPDLPFRGSRNQRIINVKGSLQKGYPVEYNGRNL